MTLHYTITLQSILCLYCHNDSINRQSGSPPNLAEDSNRKNLDYLHFWFSCILFNIKLLLPLGHYDIAHVIYIFAINRDFSKWNPDSLTALQKDINIELILISASVNSEIRITSTFMSFYHADRLSGFHFEKPLMIACYVGDII